MSERNILSNMHVSNETCVMMLTAIVLGIGFCDIYNLNVRWSGGKKVNHPWELLSPQEVVHLVDLVEKIREKKITDVIAEKKVGEEHCVPGGLSRCGRRFNEVSLYA